jgi:Fe-S cluster biogenesis protein NfuA/nitrite reductase/ring-hydroxylating ferredoxin subunit
VTVGWTDQEARERVAALEERLERLDPAAVDAVSGLVEVYGEALGRIVHALPADAIAQLAADELVGQLLLIHDLNPQPVAARVTAALEEVRPYLASHGGGVELVGIEGAVVRLRLEGHCNGCPSSSATLELAVHDAIRAAAPEIERIDTDGAIDERAPVPLAVWSVVGELPELGEGGTLVRDVSREPLLFVRLAGRVYAYRPVCPGCGGSLAEATLDGHELTCACGRRYDVVAAGQCLDEPSLHLDPLPLLDGGGRVKVAQREAVPS